MERISSREDFDRLVGSGSDFLLLKHSVTCGVSRKAMEEYKKFIEGEDGFDYYYLVVQTDRGLSDYVAKVLGVKHESPQLFLFRDGDLVWHDSHYLINVEEISKHVQT